MNPYDQQNQWVNTGIDNGYDYETQRQFQEMANQMTYGQAPGMLIANNYGDQRFMRELDKYNSRLVAKMNNLAKVPHVTKQMVLEAIHNAVSSSYGYVDFNALTYKQYDDMPPRNVWRHACYHMGLIQSEMYVTYVYTTEVYFTFCVGCGVVHYYYEKRGEEYI